MIKILSVLVSASTLVILSRIFGADAFVHVEPEFPAHVRSGDSFDLKFTVNKGSVSGYGKLQLTLPDGFVAEGDNTEGGQFSLEGKSVKLIWVAMPEQASFVIHLKVRVDANASGNKIFNGTFTYLKSGKTQTVTLKEFSVPTDDRATTASQYPRPEITRRLLIVSQEKGEYRVDLTIHHQLSGLPARFVDKFEEGTRVALIDAHGGEYSFDNKSVTFNWAKIPEDSVYTISYQVRSQLKKSAPVISGMFIYGDEIQPSPEAVAAEAEASPEPASNGTSTENQVADQIIQAYVQSEAEKQVSASTSTPAGTIAPPAQPNGIYFQVQIAATRTSPVRNHDWFRSHYNILENVDLTDHEGWKKYTIGNFNSYPEARACKQTTRQKVSDAFVVAYEQGQRIPVRDAIHARSINQ